MQSRRRLERGGQAVRQGLGLLATSGSGGGQVVAEGIDERCGIHVSHSGTTLAPRQPSVASRHPSSAPRPSPPPLRAPPDVAAELPPRRWPVASSPCQAAHGTDVTSSASAGGRRAHVDDADSFTRFYTAEHGQLVTAVRFTLDDPALAREAVDEAFTRAAERWSSVRDMRNRRGWVYRVAVNWATSWRRKLALRPTRTAEALDRTHQDPVPDVDLAAALRRLPPDHRQALVLRYALGCSVAETAQLLGVAEGTIKSRVHRARAELVEDGSWQLDGFDDDLDDVEQEVSDGRA
ncbi:sigma-70 family RNA polymerase sigma factor [Nitriliruptoraceae bacterium ZYF776]|nr:sigma-70 family RNA polymerase sigma factor [Profundirhabdus halotolerans]